MSAKKSCYVLELSVQPGGSRWAETHAYTTAGHLRLILEEFCKNDDGHAAYHALWYGATLAVWVVQKGVVTKLIDLHPFIRAHPWEGTPFLLSDAAAAQDALGEADDDGEELFEQAEEVKLELFWDGVEEQLPALDEPLLGPGEETAVEHRRHPKVATHLEGAVTFGSYEHESGEDLEPPFELDAAEGEGDEADD